MVCPVYLFLRIKLFVELRTRHFAQCFTEHMLDQGVVMSLITSTQEAGLFQKSKEHFVLSFGLIMLLLLGTFSFGLHSRMGWGIHFQRSEDNLRRLARFCLVGYGY